MRSEPARLAEISLDFAGISTRRDENFPYERSIPVREAGWNFCQCACVS